MTMTRDATGSTSGQAGEHVVRRGRAAWLTHPPAGTARVDTGGEGLAALAVSLPDGSPLADETTPGELLAVAHAMFAAAALSEELVQAGSPADEIVVEAACAFSGQLPDRDLVALGLDVYGRVPGLDATAFREAAVTARRRSLRAAATRADLPGDLRATVETYHP